MNEMRRFILSFVCLCVVSFEPLAAQHFGKPNDVRFASQLWQALKENNLVGRDVIHSYFYEGVEPHGFVLELLEAKVTVGGRRDIVIVKRNYGPEGVGVDTVSKDPKRYLEAVTVMFKREAGYDDDNRDWFWVKYDADGTIMANPAGVRLAGRVAKGQKKGCIACHAGAEKRDFVFNHNRYAR